jgi:hypothetical protein
MHELIDLLQRSPYGAGPLELALTLVKASVPLAIGLLLLAALPRLSAATKHLVLSLSLCSVLLLPALALLAPGWAMPLPDWLSSRLERAVPEHWTVSGDPGLFRDEPELAVSAAWQAPAELPALNAAELPAMYLEGRPAMPSVGIPSVPVMGMPAMPSAEMPAMPSVEMPAMPSAGMPAMPSVEMPDMPSAGMPAMPSVEMPMPRSHVLRPAALEQASPGALLDRHSPMRTRFLWAAGLAAAWLAGAWLLLGRLAAGLLRVARVEQRSTPVEDHDTLELLDAACGRIDLAAPPRLLWSGDVQVPVIGGLLRPAILLPIEAAGWSSERLRVVFLHELAHLRRRDHLTLLLHRVIAALYWFNPLVWQA